MYRKYLREGDRERERVLTRESTATSTAVSKGLELKIGTVLSAVQFKAIRCSAPLSTNVGRKLMHH